MGFCVRYLAEHYRNVVDECRRDSRTFVTISVADLQTMVEFMEEVDDDMTNESQTAIG